MRKNHRWTGKPRSGLPSGKNCYKQSDPEQFGCPSDIMTVKVHVESKNPSTLYTPTSSSFGSPCGLSTREHSSRYHYPLMIALENRLCKLHNGISQELESRINTKSFPRIRGDESSSSEICICFICFSPHTRG